MISRDCAAQAAFTDHGSHDESSARAHIMEAARAVLSGEDQALRFGRLALTALPPSLALLVADPRRTRAEAARAKSAAEAISKSEKLNPFLLEPHTAQRIQNRLTNLFALPAPLSRRRQYWDVSNEKKPRDVLKAEERRERENEYRRQLKQRKKRKREEEGEEEGGLAAAAAGGEGLVDGDGDGDGERPRQKRVRGVARENTLTQRSGYEALKLSF